MRAPGPLIRQTIQFSRVIDTEFLFRVIVYRRKTRAFADGRRDVIVESNDKVRYAPYGNNGRADKTMVKTGDGGEKT